MEANAGGLAGQRRGGNGGISPDGPKDLGARSQAENLQVRPDDRIDKLGGRIKEDADLAHSARAREGGEMGHHGLLDGAAVGGVAKLGADQFLAGSEKDDESDEKKHEKGRIKEAKTGESDGDPLPRPRRVTCGGHVVEAQGEDGAKNAAAVHRKSRDDIEDDEDKIRLEQRKEEGRREIRGDNAESYGKDKQSRCDADIYGGTGGGNGDILPGGRRDSFQSRDAADRQEGDIRGANAKGAGGEGVAELVEQDAEKTLRTKMIPPKSPGQPPGIGWPFSS